MKNIVRAFVLALALTGMFASTHANASNASASATASISTGKTSAMPVPRCDPDDPNGCGIADQ
jgi:hypothetical protein